MLLLTGMLIIVSVLRGVMLMICIVCRGWEMEGG